MALDWILCKQEIGMPVGSSTESPLPMLDQASVVDLRGASLFLSLEQFHCLRGGAIESPINWIFKNVRA